MNVHVSEAGSICLLRHSGHKPSSNTEMHFMHDANEEKRDGSATSETYAEECLHRKGCRLWPLTQAYIQEVASGRQVMQVMVQ